MTIEELVQKVMADLNEKAGTRYNKNRRVTIENIKSLKNFGYNLPQFLDANTFYVDKWKAENDAEKFQPGKEFPDEIYTIDAFKLAPQKDDSFPIDDSDPENYSDDPDNDPVKEDGGVRPDDYVAPGDGFTTPTPTTKPGTSGNYDHVPLHLPNPAEIKEFGKRTNKVAKVVDVPVGNNQAGITQYEQRTVIENVTIRQPILTKEEAEKMVDIIEKSTGRVPVWREWKRPIMNQSGVPGTRGKAIEGTFMTTVVNGDRYFVQHHVYVDLKKAL